MDLIGTAYVNPEMDEVSVFGFCVAFVTVVVMLYQRELKTRLPLLGGLFALLSGYGFLAGVWPVGIVFAALAVAEFGRSRRVVVESTPAPAVELPVRRVRAAAGAARMSRMFGS